ncbi:cholesterol side-chain cleavage enzyme, mitochondrial-like isoform X1 [Conger conger]|uniref:cholesterol side-chain cleavage enzyme, mitochondrial-like isoform X1 n=1 Tax=Conger conger TaxID=82655 RepID=UPI002A59FE3D|nr:cholesterol side-chain cleavage enzyme, mitochondrial-like isoform X1 [Conger conger]
MVLSTYREKIGSYESVNIIEPEDAAIMFKAEGHYPRRLMIEAWSSYRDYRNHRYGVLLKDGEDWKSNRVVLNKQVIAPAVQGNFVPLLDEVGQDFMARIQGKIEKSRSNKWTVDLSNELFKYALECEVFTKCHTFHTSKGLDSLFDCFVEKPALCLSAVSSVLYGERLGLLQDHIEPAAQHFIDCITLMFKSTSPMLYIPPWVLRRLGARTWKDHVEAWDGIFSHADHCMHNIFKRMKQEPGHGGRYPGVLATLMLQGQLSIEDIKASVTELMAGGVDTTSTTLLWTLYELAKQPELQEELRAEIAAARLSSQGDLVEMLKMVPLVKGALKETLRLHPVAVNLQRYITQDIVIQNYHIPSGTLVQLGLYAMGRDHQIFQRPEQYRPSRWLQGNARYFRSLGFGFGPRQCLGRRIAETEMQLFLIHMLEKFKIENQGEVDMRSTFALIIIPEKPIVLTIRPL